MSYYDCYCENYRLLTKDSKETKAINHVSNTKAYNAYLKSAKLIGSLAIEYHNDIVKDIIKENKDVSIIVIYKRGEIIGSALVDPFEIHFLDIAEKYRNQGEGRKFVDFYFSHIANFSQPTKVTVTSSSRSFWRRLGFEQSGCIQYYKTHTPFNDDQLISSIKLLAKNYNDRQIAEILNIPDEKFKKLEALRYGYSFK